MTETPKCPYCGAEMSLSMWRRIDGDYAGQWVCKACKSVAPTGKWDFSKKKAEESATSAALHRAEPEMRPLTLEEVKSHCAKGPDAEPLWAEFKEECAISRWIFAVIPPDVFDRPVLSEWIATDRSEKYGKEWRCWPRKPTPEQMAAAEWEE